MDAIPSGKHSNYTNLVDEYGMNALMKAAMGGYAEVVRTLAINGCGDIEMSDKNGHTSVLWAVSSGDLETVRLIAGGQI